MRFHHEQSYPAAPDAVFALLTDRDFREAVTAATGASTYDVSVSTTDGVTRVTTVRHQDTAAMSTLARSVLGNRLTIRQEESWSSPTKATVTVSIPGQPGRVDGTATLQAGGAGTVEIVSGEVTAKIPFIGGKVERLIADVLTDFLEQQAARAAERLTKEA